MKNVVRELNLFIFLFFFFLFSFTAITRKLNAKIIYHFIHNRIVFHLIFDIINRKIFYASLQNISRVRTINDAQKISMSLVIASK